MVYTVLTDSFVFSRHETREGAEESLASAKQKANEQIATLEGEIEEVSEFIRSLEIV